MNPLIGMPGGWEWLIILAVVILIFGAAKLPELARATGQSLRIFKDETKGITDDESDTAPESGTATRELPKSQPESTTKPTVEGTVEEPKQQRD